ncbi:MAG: aminodeoxychorismate synthase component I [Deltaproteobacteria bacterium]|nr:aminodeoxychorismate synthase component I [Deltaproteobacteria bacterium]
MTDINRLTENITGVRTKRILTHFSFTDIASRFAAETGTVMLMSGGSLDCAGYHILGIRPWMTFTGKGKLFTIQLFDTEHRLEGNPFDILKTILTNCRIDDLPREIPFGAGLMGYLSYDLKDYIEELPRTSIDDLNLPVISLFAPSIILIYDNNSQQYTLCVPEKDGLPVIPLEHAEEILLSNAEKGLKNKEGFFNRSCSNLKSNFTQAEYESVILKIREYIASGHVYQVNMSQRFEMDYSGDPFSLFMKLFNENPAPFFAFINAGDHQIVSTSPERFLTFRGNNVETRPIKGTKPRGKTEEEDEKNRLQLLNSKKDEAELSMIVDLMRNDIGKVCEASSVKLKEHKRLEAYENVYHLVSIVEGILKNGCDETDLLRATFPGGSITGCPKVRAMEIIDELEPNRRHVYTGSIGYISFHRSMDLSIAIRTATIYNNRIYFAFGGGVVYDSDPLDEYIETLHKGRTIIKTLKRDGDINKYEPMAWINGTVKPLSAGAVKLTDFGLQYGYGFFETIRVNSGRISYLEDHIERFRNTWKIMFEHPFPDITWDEIIRQVISANCLEKSVAAVKIIATYGDRDIPPYNHGLIVTARPYIHRLEGKAEKGLRLGIYPKHRQSPLADHKTLNYLYYYMAGKWAKENSFDEALILNPDNSLSETNTANILIIRDRKIIRPVSQHVLRGIMEKNICKFLEAGGYHIEERLISPDDLSNSDSLMITNSLIGAIPVISIGDMGVEEPTGLCNRINNTLLGI